MPNHVHLLGEIPDTQNLSKFMHDLNRTHTLYFNNKYRKAGHLWQGRFKNRNISKDSCLIHCIDYIEFNPLRSALAQNFREYPRSSYKLRILDEKEGIIDGIPQI
jgi:putative transposase